MCRYTVVTESLFSVCAPHFITQTLLIVIFPLPFVYMWVTGQGQNTYSIKKMEDTFFGDLRMRPGVKYVFCHCGDCEHALVFTQMFRATISDCRIPAGCVFGCGCECGCGCGCGCGCRRVCMYGWVSEYHFGCTDVLMATREVCRFVSPARFYFHAHKRAQKHTLL